MPDRERMERLYGEFIRERDAGTEILEQIDCNGEVFRVGDKIRMTGGGYSVTAIGSEGIITELNCGYDRSLIKVDFYLLTGERSSGTHIFDVSPNHVEKIGEHVIKEKFFKVEDTVIGQNQECINGKIGKIRYIDDKEIWSEGQHYLIEFDENIGGHDGQLGKYSGKEGHCWWVKKDDIILYKKVYELQIGDRVKIRKDSKYYSEQGRHGIGTIKEKGSSSYIVIFDDEYSNFYRTEDLTLRIGERRK